MLYGTYSFSRSCAIIWVFSLVLTFLPVKARYTARHLYIMHQGYLSLMKSFVERFRTWTCLFLDLAVMLQSQQTLCSYGDAAACSCACESFSSSLRGPSFAPSLGHFWPVAGGRRDVANRRKIRQRQRYSSHETIRGQGEETNFH